MGSSDKKGEKRPHPKGVSGHFDGTNTSPESKARVETAHDLASRIPPDPNAKPVSNFDNRHHGEVDQGTRPTYKEVERYSHRNESNKPSSPKPKEGSKSPSHSEATKKSKCVSMSGVSIDPRPAPQRYKLVL